MLAERKLMDQGLSDMFVWKAAKAHVSREQSLSYSHNFGLIVGRATPVKMAVCELETTTFPVVDTDPCWGTACQRDH